MNFRLPLATAKSERVFRCYASHGKGYGFASGPDGWPRAVRILLVNAAREVRWEDGTYVELHRWECAAVAGEGGWRRLGWLPGDGSLPFGTPDEVDPELAQFEFLPGVNTETYVMATAQCFPERAGR